MESNVKPFLPSAGINERNRALRQRPNISLISSHAKRAATLAAAAFTTCVAQAGSFPVRPGNLITLVGHTVQVQSFCGWIGVQVSPMTLAFADSLGMVEPYGAIFNQPEPGSPAANAGIEAGDVVTTINGSALKGSSDFLPIISAMGPGSMVYLSTFRNGEMIEVRLVLGSSICAKSGTAQPSSWRDPLYPMSHLSADL
jgi:membrane-associated protease RseP (regulator of RpoE activity)